MKAPRVSICIPAYRQPAGLTRALQSLLVQDYRDYEVIVTDDSPDAAVEDVCRAYAARLPLHYVRHAPPKGTPENWNAAMRLARGDYIKILHHDDWFTGPQALGAFVRLLDGHPEAEIAFSGCLNINVHGELVNRRVLPPAGLRRLQRRPGRLLCGNPLGGPSATIFRRQLDLFFDPQFKWLVDTDFYIRVLRRGHPVAYDPEPLVSMTVQSSQQVTAACENNRSVEITENFALYGKLLASGAAGLLAFNHMLNLCLRFAVTGEPAVRAAGYGGPIPRELRVYFAGHRLVQGTDWLLQRLVWGVKVLTAVGLYAVARGWRLFRRGP